MFSPFNLTQPIISTWILLAVIWSIPWKGVALWRAARNKHLIWFIVLLLVNTLAILEIIYIFGFSKSKKHKKKKKSKKKK